MRIRKIIGVLALLTAQTSYAEKQEFLIGTYTQEGSEGIYRVALDHKKQEFKNLRI